MKREDYIKCITPYMRGPKSKEERQLAVCIGAKICSGKAKDEQEARYLCSLPKEPKPAKATKNRTGKTCEKEVLELARCMVDKIDMNLANNINSVETTIINAMMECKCGGK